MFVDSYPKMFYWFSFIALCVVYQATEGAEPPNEWGNYYSLPAEFDEMETKFHEIFGAYSPSEKSQTGCDHNEAIFERWFKSSVNENHYILSYYCRTKTVRGYEHMKVDLAKKTVLDFQTALKGFNIMDAGDYRNSVPEENGKELEKELLNAVKDQIALQKTDWDGKPGPEYCPEPGSQTFYDMKAKKENGLYYHEIAISCKVNKNSEYASHMTNIEVVEDKDFKVVFEGEPLLAVMKNPSRNIQFIQEMEARAAAEVETEHQLTGSVDQIVAPGLFIWLVPAVWMCYLNLFDA